MGALRSLQQGLALLRAIAQSEAVRDARNRVLERIGEQTTRLVQSGLVPKAMTAPAELLAEFLAKRPSAATEPSFEPEALQDTATLEVVEMSTPAEHEVQAQAEPSSTETQVAEGRRPKRAAGTKKAAKREASGVSAPSRKRTASAATSKKPVRRTKKVRDKAEPVK